MKPSEFEEVRNYLHLRRFLDKHFDMQVNDVRCLLLLPKPDCDLDAGYNFSVVNLTLDLISGLRSVLLSKPRRAQHGR